jgi:hypothetical protein
MRYTTEIQNRLISVRSTVLEIEKEQIKNKHEEMSHRLHEFQSIHLERQGDILSLRLKTYVAIHHNCPLKVGPDKDILGHIANSPAAEQQRLS